jgi:hypothetical protein
VLTQVPQIATNSRQLADMTPTQLCQLPLLTALAAAKLVADQLEKNQCKPQPLHTAGKEPRPFAYTGY